ncbi:MAG: F0F1 ATP synthase subunit epsilon [Bacteroidales bacterium]|jgi:F-type H+-transporting ATPase subunit epsilon|nr:F0F1 ATP synthase subunit epsilon [Bacteroidales bacterium]
MNLNIVTPGNALFTGECISVRVPGINGPFEVLDRHAPIISLLRRGRIKVQDTNKAETFFNIESGVVKVNRNDVVILVNG